MQKKNDIDPGFKIGEHVETFLHTETLQIRLQNFSLLKKNAFPWTYVTEDLNREKYLKKNYKTQIKQIFRV